MNEEQKKSLEAILERTDAIEDEASDMAERQYTAREARDLKQKSKDIVADYRSIVDALPPSDELKVERHYGRKVTDMRRKLDWLPRLDGGGDAVPLATNDQWLLPDQRVSASSAAPRERYRPAPTGPSVGGEIDAWCGPCKGIRSHNIVAMVGDVPKQVLCQSCGARHGFRLTAARTAKNSDRDRLSPEKRTAQEVEARKKETARTELQKELVAATDVRNFSRRGRYKAGEIIDHPEHGRGKIENVLKGSLLVRFRVGLRPVSTV